MTPLALVGPTASGKTDASLPIARALDAEILSVDSMVVYRGMDVGTAKPGLADRAAVPHHLIDVAEPAEPFSVAEYQRLALQTLDVVERAGHAALLVGGSGLYFRAIVDRLEFPGTEQATRALLEAEAVAAGPSALYRRLSETDPAAAARIEPADVRRTVRALEVAAVTGRPFSSFAQGWESYPPANVRAAGVDVPRAILRARIERRVDQMMPGLLAETRALLEAGAGGFLTAMQAIGYLEAAACLEGAISEAEAAARTVKRTNALARHQLAWFRRDPRIRWFEVGAEGAIGATDAIIGYLGAREDHA